MIIEKVFVSHATEDHDIADRVRRALEEERISVWLAPNDIRIGSPNWDKEIRKAIESVDGVILIATPDACDSSFVRGELELADKFKRPIFPLWARGDDRLDATPLGYGIIQSYDVRGERFDAGMDDLVAHFRAAVGPDSRIAAKDREYLRQMQRAERTRIFEAFKSKVKAAWGNRQASWTQKLAALPTVLDAGGQYMIEIAEMERHWGDQLVPDDDLMSRNLIAIIGGLQRAFRDEEASWLKKSATLIKHGAELIAELERHWGMIGGETVQGSVAEESLILGEDKSEDEEE